MKVHGKLFLEESTLAQEGPSTVIAKGAFGTGKKTVPFYSGPEGDPNRRVIGEAIVDLETGEMEAEIHEQP